MREGEKEGGGRKSTNHVLFTGDDRTRRCVNLVSTLAFPLSKYVTDGH